MNTHCRRRRRKKRERRNGRNSEAAAARRRGRKFNLCTVHTCTIAFKKNSITHGKEHALNTARTMSLLLHSANVMRSLVVKWERKKKGKVQMKYTKPNQLNVMLILIAKHLMQTKLISN